MQSPIQSSHDLGKPYHPPAQPYREVTGGQVCPLGVVISTDKTGPHTAIYTVILLYSLYGLYDLLYGQCASDRGFCPSIQRYS